MTHTLKDRQRKSAEYAVRWLCSVADAELDDMPRDVVAWFLDHREIDLEIATAMNRAEDAGSALVDIARAKKLLAVSP